MRACGRERADEPARKTKKKRVRANNKKKEVGQGGRAWGRDGESKRGRPRKARKT